METQMKTTIKQFVILGTIAITVVLATKLASTVSERLTAAQEVKRKTICPSLLSISRSARDTFIVMKAENLCNEFVLDNLK